MEKKSGVYLLSEIQCLTPGTGAYEHVQNGLKELKKYYNIELVLLAVDNRKSSRSVLGVPVQAGRKRQLPFKSLIKWLYLFFIRNYDVFRWFFKIRRQRPQFIYERASYLSYKGVIIARMLGIPHFYEVNGAFYLEHSKSYPRFLTTLAKKMENVAYNFSTFSFFVGGISECFKLRRDRYINVQNGIERSFIDLLKGQPKVHQKNSKLNVIFIGHAMSHHRLDLLEAAFKEVGNPQKFHLHFVGGNYEKFGLKFPSTLQVTFHGILGHSEIASLLPKMQVGILPYGVFFVSAVKLFMYGAAKLVLVIPDAKNLTTIFSGSETMVFKNEDVKDMARVLNEVAENFNNMQGMGCRVYEKVMNCYLWEHVFSEQVSYMNHFIEGVSKQ